MPGAPFTTVTDARSSWSSPNAGHVTATFLVTVAVNCEPHNMMSGSVSGPAVASLTPGFPELHGAGAADEDGTIPVEDRSGPTAEDEDADDDEAVCDHDVDEDGVDQTPEADTGKTPEEARREDPPQEVVEDAAEEVPPSSNEEPGARAPTGQAAAHATQSPTPSAPSS